MDLGVLTFATDRSMRPSDLARAVEDRGFESMWVTEHTHIPTSRETPWPGGPELPEEYKRTMDPFVALTSAASTTSRLRLGTAVCLVAQHDPIVLAKSVASLDLVSGGRFEFGIGLGWNREEMASHGVCPSRRRALVREKVLAMCRLWSDDVASFSGTHVKLEPSWMWPKPVQRPRPPITLGGAGGPLTFQHVLEYCDGWMPIHGRGDLLGAISELRRTAWDAGRDPSAVRIGVFGVPGDPAVIDAYREAGVMRCLLPVPSADDDIVLTTLDRYARLLRP